MAEANRKQNTFLSELENWKMDSPSLAAITTAENAAARVELPSRGTVGTGAAVHETPKRNIWDPPPMTNLFNGVRTQSSINNPICSLGGLEAFTGNFKSSTPINLKKAHVTNDFPDTNKKEKLDVENVRDIPPK